MTGPASARASVFATELLVHWTELVRQYPRKLTLDERFLGRPTFRLVSDPAERRVRNATGHLPILYELASIGYDLDTGGPAYLREFAGRIEGRIRVSEVVFQTLGFLLERYEQQTPAARGKLKASIALCRSWAGNGPLAAKAVEDRTEFEFQELGIPGVLCAHYSTVGHFEIAAWLSDNCPYLEREEYGRAFLAIVDEARTA